MIVRLVIVHSSGDGNRQHQQHFLFFCFAPSFTIPFRTKFANAISGVTTVTTAGAATTTITTVADSATMWSYSRIRILLTIHDEVVALLMIVAR